jgi:hypothetical protein
MTDYLGNAASKQIENVIAMDFVDGKRPSNRGQEVSRKCRFPATTVHALMRLVCDWRHAVACSTLIMTNRLSAAVQNASTPLDQHHNESLEQASLMLLKPNQSRFLAKAEHIRLILFNAFVRVAGHTMSAGRRLISITQQTRPAEAQ